MPVTRTETAEAWQVTQENVDAVAEWLGAHVDRGMGYTTRWELRTQPHGGRFIANGLWGWYVIRFADGSHRVESPQQFTSAGWSPASLLGATTVEEDAT